jgi:hypothetical protein
MAPVPVILLLFVVPCAVLVILLVSFCLVTSVGMVFAFIPVVVVVVIANRRLAPERSLAVLPRPRLVHWPQAPPLGIARSRNDLQGAYR